MKRFIKSYDELSRIERNFGSVAEYYRSMNEYNPEEDERREQAAARYKVNQDKLSKADQEDRVVPYGWHGRCEYNCPYMDDDTQQGPDDDCGHVICNRPEGICLRVQKMIENGE